MAVRTAVAVRMTTIAAVRTTVHPLLPVRGEAVHHPVAAQEEAGKRVGELQSQMYSESHRPLNSGAERPDRVEVGNTKNVADSYSYFGIELISDF